VIVGVAFVKLLSVLCNIIRRHLQLAPWRVEVVSDSDPRVHPIDPHGVCSHLQYPISFSENLQYLQCIMFCCDVECLMLICSSGLPFKNDFRQS